MPTNSKWILLLRVFLVELVDTTRSIHQHALAGEEGVRSIGDLSFTRGYSAPSSQAMVSLEAAVERLRNVWPLLMSLKTTKR